MAEDERERMPRADLPAVEADVGVTEAAAGHADPDGPGVERRQLERLERELAGRRQDETVCLHAPTGGNGRAGRGAR